MARLTNEQIRNMSINEADVYTDAHPAEAWRFAKAHGATAIAQTKKAAKHGFETRFSLQNLKRSSLPDNTRPPLTVCSS